MKRFAFHISALAGLLLAGSQFLAQAQVISTTNPGSAVTSGIVGVTITQTARLNVLNLQPPAITGAAPVQCLATLEFYNDAGILLKLPTPPMTFNIQPGAAVSLAIKPPMPSLAVNARAQIRAVVTTPSNILMTPSTGPASPVVMPVSLGCNLMPSLEIIDDITGLTHTFTTDFRPVPASNILPMAVH